MVVLWVYWHEILVSCSIENGLTSCEQDATAQSRDLNDASLEPHWQLVYHSFALIDAGPGLGPELPLKLKDANGCRAQFAILV